MPLNLYLISTPASDYETYTDMLIAADSANEAKDISVKSVEDEDDSEYINRVWGKADTLKAKLLGIADSSIEKGIIKSWWKNG